MRKVCGRHEDRKAFLDLLKSENLKTCEKAFTRECKDKRAQEYIARINVKFFIIVPARGRVHRHFVRPLTGLGIQILDLVVEILHLRSKAWIWTCKSCGFGGPNPRFGCPSPGFGVPNPGFGGPNPGFGSQLN